jgi:hypothetical protein
MGYVRISFILMAAAMGFTCGGAAGQTVDAASSSQTHLPKTKTIEVRKGAEFADSVTNQRPVGGDKDIEVSVRARLVKADAAPEREGDLMLTVISELDQPGRSRLLPGPPRLIIKLPLSSSGDAYGESRSCEVSKEGVPTFIFTAGLDEKNFVPFAAAKSDREFRFSLNKYLCRALAAPFKCKGFAGPPTEVKLPAEMVHWKVGSDSFVQLDSKSASAKAEVSEITVRSSGKPFDYATCAQVAPSNGLCCVQHKTTEWHCGGKPEGVGWHQVSGDCYHRETGGSCAE